MREKIKKIFIDIKEEGYKHMMLSLNLRVTIV